MSPLPIPQGFVPKSPGASISLIGSIAAVHSQTSSWLYRIPNELRRLIYDQLLGNGFEGIHLWLNASSNIAWSRCVGVDDLSLRNLSLCTHDSASQEQKTIAQQRQWAYRISSPWGGHWKCEEYRHGDDAFGEESTCCKLMYIEFAKYVLETAIVHFTDFNILNCLVKAASIQQSIPSNEAAGTINDRQLRVHQNTTNALSVAYHSIRRLSISLCPSPSFYTAQDSNDDNPTGTPSLTPKHQISHNSPSTTMKQEEHAQGQDDDNPPSYVPIWNGLFPVLRRMPCLRSLDVRLDHTGSKLWPQVNERAVLAGLCASDICKQIQVNIYLPELDERWINPAGHFVGVPGLTTATSGLFTRNGVSYNGSTKTMLDGGDDFSFTIHRHKDFPYFANRQVMERSDKSPEPCFPELFFLDGICWPYSVMPREDSFEEYPDWFDHGPSLTVNSPSLSPILGPLDDEIVIEFEFET